ncbi:hypothetical protein [Marinobacter sp.]|uniref:hypothetical protein n=1 Tax=Marinobacter sp. TaxID=50741 RepID=UPI003569CFE2
MLKKITIMAKYVLYLLGLTGFLLSGPVFADPPKTPETRDYILWYRNYDNPAIYALVRLALEKTPEYGAFNLLRSVELSQGRVLRELAGENHKLVTIANVATTPEREAILSAIPIPIDGGLLGFRVCLVLPEALPRFSGIKNIADFETHQIRIGQGTHWPDTPILENNGIQVVTHARYEILFGMLKNHRFECFARGISEVMFDMEHSHAEGLVIEPNLLLAYAMPSYLFVARTDLDAAHRLQLGLERAIIDGSFAKYLKRSFGKAISELGLERRTVIALDNPYLTEDSEYVARHILENLRRRIEYMTSKE